MRKAQKQAIVDNEREKESALEKKKLLVASVVDDILTNFQKDNIPVEIGFAASGVVLLNLAKSIGFNKEQFIFYCQETADRVSWTNEEKKDE